MQVRVPEMTAGAAFYERLIGRSADLSPDPAFQEWEVYPGTWLQVCLGTQPLRSRMRFGMDDIEKERASLRTGCALAPPVLCANALCCCCDVARAARSC